MKFSLDNEVVAEMIEWVKEISTRREEDSHLLAQIMAIR